MIEKYKNIDQIKSYKIFNNISDDTAKDIINNIKIKSIQKNEIIIKEGQEGNSLVILFNGNVNVTREITLSTKKK